MSTPSIYFGSGMHASAVLKRDYRAVRAAHPDRYVNRRRQITEMDGNGKVSVVQVTDDVAALPPSPRLRHRFCMEK